MTVRARFRGHMAYWDEESDWWRYEDDNTPVPEDPADERPCILCGLSPTEEGHDGCLGEIPRATSACCGHGVQKGYIIWPGKVRRMVRDKERRDADDTEL